MITLNSVASELRDRNGQEVRILRTIADPDEFHDWEVLPMYVVEFPDGLIAEVWSDELVGVS